MQLQQPLLVLGDAQNMKELEDESVHLVVTSPPYFNAPFDYPNMFASYDEYLEIMRNVAKEIYRVLQKGRVVCIVCDDVLVGGKRYPIVADLTRIYLDVGFNYRDRITWLKPEGYIRISRRSGVILQHPYPLYFYPDNIQESILIFQKDKLNYKDIPPQQKELSRINVEEFQRNKIYLNVWQITNVLPHPNRLEKGIAAFPAELARRLILLYSYVNDIVLDPFLGSGTTMQVALACGRGAVGYEIDASLKSVILQKLSSVTRNIQIVEREDARRVRMSCSK